MDLSSLLKSEIFWTALGAIATVFGAAAIFFAARQLRFEAWLKAQELWTEPDFTRERGRIFERLDSGRRVNWGNEAEREEALYVCRRMDEFAGLIPYLPKRKALQIWGAPFAKAWLVLKPVVEAERVRAWPDKWLAFDKFGSSAVRKHPEFQFKPESPLPSQMEQSE